MQMISMKMDPQEAQADACCAPCDPGDAPLYPYGLSLSLNDEVMRKLGIPLPDVNVKYTLVANVEVCSASKTDTQDGSELYCSLQITDMQLSPATGGDPAAMLWPDKE